MGRAVTVVALMAFIGCSHGVSSPANSPMFSASAWEGPPGSMRRFLVIRGVGGRGLPSAVAADPAVRAVATHAAMDAIEVREEAADRIAGVLDRAGFEIRPLVDIIRAQAGPSPQRKHQTWIPFQARGCFSFSLPLPPSPRGKVQCAPAV